MAELTILNAVLCRLINPQTLMRGQERWQTTSRLVSAFGHISVQHSTEATSLTRKWLQTKMQFQPFRPGSSRRRALQAHKPADDDAGAGATANDQQLGPPAQALHPGPHTRPQPALLLHRYLLQVPCCTPQACRIHTSNQVFSLGLFGIVLLDHQQLGSTSPPSRPSNTALSGIATPSSSPTGTTHSRPLHKHPLRE